MSSFFDPDTVACPQSLSSYLYAVGGSVESVDQIISNHNNKVFFLTGTDEHALKIQKAAEKDGLEDNDLAVNSIEEFVDMS